MTTTQRLSALLLAVCASVGASVAAVKRVEEFIEPAPLQPEVHASTLVEAAPGVMVAAWFAGSKEGNVDVSIWSARRENGAWSAAREVVRATGPAGEAVPAYNPVIFQPGEAGRLALVHSAGWEGKPWLGWLQWSDDQGRTWSQATRLPAGVRGPDRNLPIRLADGRWLHPSTSGGVHVEFSDATLTHWDRRPKVEDPEKFRALQPTLLDHGNGRLQMLCRTYRRELATAWSSDGGLSWSPLESLGITLANSAIAAARLPDGSFALLYNPSGPPANAKEWGARHPLTLAVSRDGITWRDVLNLETAPIREGYAYPCVIVGRDGFLHVTYTWGRKRIRYTVIDLAGSSLAQ